MASDVKECYDWGILGCGWLGLAFARSVIAGGGSVWGTARSSTGLNRMEDAGIPAFRLELDGVHVSTPGTPPCRTLLVALPAGVGMEGIIGGYNACLTDRTRWTVHISSTSVYPMGAGRFAEADAVHRVSPHSGVDVLEVEQGVAGPNCSILRAGGLVGPGRPMFRRPPSDDDHLSIMTAIHQDDVVNAIRHVQEQKLVGPANLVCPIVRSRNECRAGQSTDAPRTFKGRQILSDRLIESGFTFRYPDPISMPDRHPPSTP